MTTELVVAQSGLSTFSSLALIRADREENVAVLKDYSKAEKMVPIVGVVPVVAPGSGTIVKRHALIVNS